MRSKPKTTRLLLIGSAVSLSGCVGSFCDVYTPVKMDRAVAEVVVAQDRRAAEDIAVNNAAYEACGKNTISFGG